MVFAEDIRKTILTLAEERGPDKTFAPADVAQRVDRENWQGLIDQVRFVASVLVKEGKIRTTQSGDHLGFIKTETKSNLKRTA
jgi:hypothetical protein